MNIRRHGLNSSCVAVNLVNFPIRGTDYSTRQHNLLSINFEQLQNSNCYFIYYMSHSYDRNEIC